MEGRPTLASTVNGDWARNLGELSQVLPDISLQNRLHGVRADAEIGRHHRRHPCRPAGPGVALLSRQAEHQRRGARPVDQFALQLLQPDLAAPAP